MRPSGSQWSRVLPESPPYGTKGAQVFASFFALWGVSKCA